MMPPEIERLLKAQREYEEAFPGRCCNCVRLPEVGQEWPEPSLHAETQDTSCEGWKLVAQMVEDAARDRREVFAPGREIPYDLWCEVITLPRSIAKLKSVKVLMLYGSNLVRIPPEIAGMTALEEFVPYTSYRLHYFPYEITRCPNLQRSTVSTRAIYGNYSYRPNFPFLPTKLPDDAPRQCSVCDGPFAAAGPLQIWISLRVATDVLPLLVYACSETCIRQLPTPPKGYITHPHTGGRQQPQPPASMR